MKNYITLLCLSVFIALSCSDTPTLEDDLVGEWVYEREKFNSNSVFEDLDTHGIMVFKEDETGTWVSNSESIFFTDMEWDLQVNESKIAITRHNSTGSASFGSTLIFDITQNGSDSFTFNYEFRYISWPDTSEEVVIFENIILTRK